MYNILLPTENKWQNEFWWGLKPFGWLSCCSRPNLPFQMTKHIRYYVSLKGHKKKAKHLFDVRNETQPWHFIHIKPQIYTTEEGGLFLTQHWKSMFVLLKGWVFPWTSISLRGKIGVHAGYKLKRYCLGLLTTNLHTDTETRITVSHF